MPITAIRAEPIVGQIRPDLAIIARTHSEREWRYLRDRVSEAIVGEREAALEMARYTLRCFDVSDEEIQATVTELRDRVQMTQPEPASPEEPVRPGT